MWFLTLVILTVPLLAIWHSTLSLLVRPLGIRLPLMALPPKKLSAAIRGLSRREYIIVEGVLGWGAGTWFLMTATDLVSSRLGGSVVSMPTHGSFASFALGLGFFMLGGMAWGWMMWNHSPHGKPSSHYEDLSISPRPHD